MNCNPFTLGHRYLIETAASECVHLYIFVVEEDKSEFKFADRIELVRKGTADLQNITILPSGKYIISQLTFTDYFGKSELQDKIIDTSFDVKLFAEKIAPVLGITTRFAGEEPLDNITRQYNASMERILPQYGLEFKVIPRKELDSHPISASRVRQLLKEENFNEIARLVPLTTLEYLVENFATNRYFE
jgi:[citrate (pro-3S)-lyase] ligase